MKEEPGTITLPKLVFVARGRGGNYTRGKKIRLKEVNILRKPGQGDPFTLNMDKAGSRLGLTVLKGKSYGEGEKRRGHV